MKPRLVVLFLVLLLLPLGLALWLGVRSIQDSQASAQTQVRAVWTGPLDELRARVATTVQGWEEALRSPTPDNPLVRTEFRLQGGVVVSPPRYQPDGTPDPFFERTVGLWDQKFWEHGGREGASAPTAGWLAWTTTEGPAFLYWYTQSGEVRGVEVDAWPLLSRLSAALPDLGWSTAEAAGRALILRDSAGKTFARWGRWEAEDSPALVTRELGAPFEGWEFRLSLAPQALGDTSQQWTIVFILVGLVLAIVLALGGWVFFRAWNATLAEAGQRVRFVNQVSHELKTPLTNILLYGELLETSLGPQLTPKSREYLEVIRGESGRLGRLITNVLTFARHETPDEPHRRALLWDEAIQGAVKPFRPGLAERGLELTAALGAASVEGQWDPDWVGQIVGNLLSNAEKYALSGRVVTVSTGHTPDHVWVRVADRGPGIPASAAEKVFQPFARLDDRLTSGAAGTGLGLGIARDLARRHGGDLVLESTDSGASFLLTLPRTEAPR